MSKGFMDMKKYKEDKEDTNLGAFLGGLVFILTALWALWSGILRPNLGQMSRDWHTVSCIVTSASVQRKDSGVSIDFVLRVRYVYNLGNVSYEGDAEMKFRRLSSRLPLLERYAKGSAHKCMVNLTSPSKSVLKIRNPEKAWSDDIGYTLVWFVFLGIGVCAILSSIVRNARFSIVRNARFIVFLLMTGCFFFVALISLVKYLVLTYSCQHYEKVQAEVLYTGINYKIEPLGGRMHKTVYIPVVGYRYFVKGEQYENDRYNYFVESIYRKESAMSEIAHFAVGDTIDVYVSRRHPQDSVLIKPYGVFPIEQLVVGLLGTIGGAVAICLGIKSFIKEASL
jgi:hypothetical protein